MYPTRVSVTLVVLCPKPWWFEIETVNVCRNGPHSELYGGHCKGEDNSSLSFDEGCEMLLIYPRYVHLRVVY